MSIREHLEEIERKTLRKEARLSENSRGRKIDEKCDLRPCFQQDRDRIIHCKAFRRLGHKTQVFLDPMGDHYRTRFTHTLEVSQIARSIAKALQLNETLSEAIALGHDLGHTPFGHIGEEVLNDIYPGGFHHVKHSARIVEFIERSGVGLNLTYEVVDGIRKHSKGRGPIISEDPEVMAETLEGQIVRLADIFAYINHDIDDAKRANLLTEDAIPKELKEILGENSSERVERMVSDVINESLKVEPIKIRMSHDLEKAVGDMRAFLFKEVYENSKAKRSFDKIYHLVAELYNYYMDHPDELEKETGFLVSDIGEERLACDFIAGMTDRYAIHKFKELFLPRSWSVL